MDIKKLNKFVKTLTKTVGQLIVDESLKHKLDPTEQFNAILSIGSNLIGKVLDDGALQVTVPEQMRAINSVEAHLAHIFKESLDICIKVNKKKGISHESKSTHH